MKVSKKCCVFCDRELELNPRAVRVVGGVVRVTQKVCARRAECRRARANRNLRRWKDLHPEHTAKYAPKVRAWAKGFPNYWQSYRQSHPEYALRDNARRARAARAALRSANEIGIAGLVDEKLQAVAVLHEGECSANETGLSRRVSALEDYVLSTSRYRVPQTETGMDDPGGAGP